MDGSTFLCHGCYRERRGNPRLGPGEQKYCSASRCQRLRKKRWERKRKSDDASLEYSQRRRDDKAKWRRAHTKEDAAYRRRMREKQRARRSQGSPSGSGCTQTPAAASTGQGKGIPPGRYVMQPLGMPRLAPQVVEVAVISFCASSSIEQVVVASETDAFAR